MFDSGPAITKLQRRTHTKLNFLCTFSLLPCRRGRIFPPSQDWGQLLTALAPLNLEKTVQERCTSLIATSCVMFTYIWGGHPRRNLYQLARDTRTCTLALSKQLARLRAERNGHGTNRRGFFCFLKTINDGL